MIDALLHREHTPYREIGHRAVAHVMDRAGIDYSKQDVRYLVGEIEKLKPFPEVPAALDKAPHRKDVDKPLVLSNGDPDMLETAKGYHKVPFDKVISVAEAGSFKPHVATYTKAAELCGLKPEQILFVANHAFDCIGAKSAGMKTAFIDRCSRPFGETPASAGYPGAHHAGSRRRDCLRGRRTSPSPRSCGERVGVRGSSRECRVSGERIALPLT